MYCPEAEGLGRTSEVCGSSSGMYGLRGHSKMRYEAGDCTVVIIVKNDVLKVFFHIFDENQSTKDYIYRSHALLGACACNSTGRKYAPISEMRLITIMTFLE